MTLLDIATTLVVAALVTWVPGALVLVAARRSVLTVLVAAPVLTCGIAYAAAEIAAAAGLGWSVWTMLAAAVVVAAVVWAVSRYVEPRWTRFAARDDEALRASTAVWSRTAWVAVIVVGAVAAVVGAYAYYATTGRFTVIPQDFDSVFQGNAIRQIADSGIATPDSLAAVNSYDTAEGLYYPSVFHALAALTVQVTGNGVLAATHAHVMLWFAIIPLGVLGVVRRTRIGAFGAGAALVVSTSFTSLPYELIWRGLLPFTLSFVLVLPLLALLVDGLRHRRLADVLLVALGILGIVSVHTSGAVTILVWCGFAVVGVLWTQRRQVVAALRWTVLLAVVTVAALVPTAVAMASVVGETALKWPLVLLPSEAVESALLFGTGYREDDQAFLAVFVLLGALAAFRPKYGWLWGLTVSTAVAMTLFVLTASVDTELVLNLTRWWWNDQLRVSALITIGAPVLVGVALDTVKDLVAKVWRSQPRAVAWQSARPAAATTASLLLCAALVVVLGLVTGGGYFERNRDAVAFKYRDGPTVSRYEAEGMAELARIVPPGQPVLNDFRDGSAWMFALEGVKPVWGAVGVSPNEGRQLLDRELNTLATNPEVADEIRARGIHYVFLGAGFVLAGMERAPGMTGLDEQPDVFELVYSNPEVQIYRILGAD